MPDLRPYDSGQPIYAFLRGHLDELGRLKDPAVSLPDEEPANSREIRFAPGALDGGFGHHGGAGQEVERASTVADALVKVANRASRWNVRRLRKSIGEEGALGIVDAVIERLVTLNPSREAIHEVGHWLATTAATRDPVKLGIALMGVTGVEGDAGVLRVLGAHDEFTLYAATAFANGLEEPESEIWALATVVDGWGRIECVERLASTNDPSIRSWILRTGYRNSIMYEYLAWIAATTGGLVEALSEDVADRELLTAAAEIIAALIDGGPAQDMDDYADGARATTLFVAHLEREAPTLTDAMALVALRHFLSADDDWDERSVNGWTATVRSALEDRLAALLVADRWADLIDQGLVSDDHAAAWQAAHLARSIGIDVFAAQIRRIEQDPINGPWFDVWQDASSDRAEQLCDLVRRLLHPDELAIGARDDLGFGPDRRGHMAFEWTLQALRNHPGVGHDLLLAGLRQPGIRSRNMALAALQHWKPAAWPEGTVQEVREVADNDPVDQVRKFAADVLAGKPPEA